MASRIISVIKDIKSKIILNFNDAGDGTCMDCGRERKECYCSIK